MSTQQGATIGCGIFAFWGLIIGIITFIASSGNPDYDISPETSVLIIIGSALALFVIYLININQEKELKEKDFQSIEEITSFIMDEVELQERSQTINNRIIKKYNIEINGSIPLNKYVTIKLISPQEKFIVSPLGGMTLMLEVELVGWEETGHFFGNEKFRTRKTLMIEPFKGIYINTNRAYRLSEGMPSFAYVVKDSESLFDLLF